MGIETKHNDYATFQLMNTVYVLAFFATAILCAMLFANKTTYNQWFTFPWSKNANDIATGKYARTELELLQSENKQLKQVVKDYEAKLGKSSAYR